MQSKSAVIKFVLGIPIWILVCFVLDKLIRAMSGMTGAGGEFGNIPQALLTFPSFFIFAYFLFSAFVASKLPHEKILRLKLAGLAHLLLIMSGLSTIVPALLHGRRDIGMLSEMMTILFLFYGVFFMPWMFVWRSLLRSWFP